MGHPAEPLDLSQPPFSDAAVRQAVDTAPRSLTYTELARELCQRFGPDRAWSAEQITRYWQATRPVHRGQPARIAQDPAIRSFIDDRLGRMTLDELTDALRRQFGFRAPSRSAIGRYWQSRRRIDTQDRR